MKVTNETDIEQFAVHFLKGRIIWRNVPKDGIINFGKIISLCLYRKGVFQVELFISTEHNSTFPNHRHPDVDTVEFGLSGYGQLFVNDKPSYTEQQMEAWLAGNFKALPIRIQPTDWHSGIGHKPYAFLSIQKWLNGVKPTSVGLNWEGEASSVEQEQMLATL